MNKKDSCKQDTAMKKNKKNIKQKLKKKYIFEFIYET